VTINSVDQSGHSIFGYYTVLYDSSGSIYSDGFTTWSERTTAGQTYSVQTYSYGNCMFMSWSDGVTSNPRTFNATSSGLGFTAVYNCSTPSTIDVSTVNSAGRAITGYYATLWQNGVETNSCFSQCSFAVTNGQTYQVAVADYGNEAFSHWIDGTTTRFYTINVSGSTSTAISLTAVYSP
jgi:hypothetical protein